jgi:hypothetical protein
MITNHIPQLNAALKARQANPTPENISIHHILVERVRAETRLRMNQATR